MPTVSVVLFGCSRALKELAGLDKRAKEKVEITFSHVFRRKRWQVSGSQPDAIMSRMELSWL